MDIKQHTKQQTNKSVSFVANHQQPSTTVHGEELVTVMQRAKNTPDRLSHSDISLLHGTLGNRTVGKVVQTKPTSTQSGRTPNNFVQRGLFDNPLGWIEGKAESAADWVGNKAEGVANWAGGKADSVADWASDKANTATNWVGNKAEGYTGDAESWVGDQAAKIEEIESEIGDILSELKQKVLGVIPGGPSGS